MRIDIITACPELLESPLNHSIIARAKSKGLCEIYVHNLRDWTLDKHRKVDDYAFGFSAGMVLQIEPIDRCISALTAERHYDEILGSMAAVTAGSCIYCNHCLPCPVSINIGDVFKYYDLTKNGDGLAKEHYASLSRHASDCIKCGDCEPRCPFQVKIIDAMGKVAGFMGR